LFPQDAPRISYLPFVDQAAAGLSLTLVFTLAQFLVFGMERATHLENNLIAVERLEEYSSLKSEASLEKEDPNGMCILFLFKN